MVTMWFDCWIFEAVLYYDIEYVYLLFSSLGVSNKLLWNSVRDFVSMGMGSHTSSSLESYQCEYVLQIFMLYDKRYHAWMGQN